MKILKFAFVIMVMVIGLSSCQKDDEAKSVAGIWEGIYGYGSEAPHFYEKWELKEGGDLNTFYPSGNVSAVGTWDLNGDEIEVHYTDFYNDSYTFIGTYAEAKDEITGNWFEVEDPTIGGAFIMRKK
jgi:hypothetical protein